MSDFLRKKFWRNQESSKTSKQDCSVVEHTDYIKRKFLLRFVQLWSAVYLVDYINVGSAPHETYQNRYCKEYVEALTKEPSSVHRIKAE